MAFNLRNSERGSFKPRVEINDRVVTNNEAAIRRARNHFIAILQRQFATEITEFFSFDANRRTTVRKKNRENLLTHRHTPLTNGSPKWRAVKERSIVITSPVEKRQPDTLIKKDLTMQLDIYRDQALEKLLIVEKGQDIHKLSINEPAFLVGLKPTRDIDADFDELPTGINKDDVLEAIKVRGYYASTFKATIKEVDC